MADVSRTAWLTERFEDHRSHLRAVAYRMLGSASDADDAVQETWLRLARSDTRDVTNLAGWLTTVVARVCLNMLRSTRTRREAPLDERAPEPAAEPDTGGDPQREAELADSVGMAMLVVLDTLSPTERISFVLHDMFAVPFDQIAPMIGRSPAAARQLASRARRRVRGTTAVATPDLRRHRRVVEAYLAAARDGDFAALVGLLDPDVVLRVDAAAMPGGAPVLLRGAAAVSKGAVGAAARAAASEPALVGGAVGAVMAPLGRLQVALGFTISGDRITAIDVIADPDRLGRLDVAVLDD